MDIRTTPQLPEFDASSAAQLLGGAAFVGLGVALILMVPEARETCGRLLQHPEVKRVAREAVHGTVRGVAAALGWEIQPNSGSSVAR